MGEPFRAEIDLLQDPDERSTLTPRLASPDLYPLSGFRYNPALSGTRLNIRAPANGRQVIEIVSVQPLNEPFVHLLVELESNATRMVRGYTALIDPYGYRAPQGGRTAEYLPAAIPAAAPVLMSAAARAPAADKRRAPVPPVPRREPLADADAKTLAAMLGRVAALEAAVAQLQRQWEKPAAVAAAQPAAEAPSAPPAGAAKTVPVAAPAPPVAQDKPAAAAESAPRRASSQDSLLNNGLLVLAIGLLMIVAWLAWVVWGPPSREAKPQGKG